MEDVKEACERMLNYTSILKQEPYMKYFEVRGDCICSFLTLLPTSYLDEHKRGELHKGPREYNSSVQAWQQQLQAGLFNDQCTLGGWRCLSDWGWTNVKSGVIHSMLWL